MNYMAVFAVMNLIVFSIVSGILLYIIIGWLFLSKYDQFLNRQEFYLKHFEDKYKIGYFQKLVDGDSCVENGTFIIFASDSLNVRFITRANMWDKLKYRYVGLGTIDIFVTPAFNDDGTEYKKITCNMVRVRRINLFRSALGHPIIDSSYMILVDGSIYKDMIETDLIYLDVVIQMRNISPEIMESL